MLATEILREPFVRVLEPGMSYSYEVSLTVPESAGDYEVRAFTSGPLPMVTIPFRVSED